MALLNYTTTIETEKTLGEVARILAKAGARSIMTDYNDEGVPVRLAFLIPSPYGELAYQLPARIENVFAVLEKQCSQGKVSRKYVSMEQAGRVGWRIVKDWLEAQMAFLEADMVTLDQLMLPYQTVDGKRTVYQVMQSHRMVLPEGKS